ncbi:MAG: NAD(P)-binding domain-containing protein [Candidatus Portnoybacteria bacterium]|nr:NAD(P)-binding domain-containing protein [Candidatus Portnoybacteria bacterium]MDD4982635.1 NAD(P)-binding domain-containing protein [Candidatus Portnoybacteria bacterium]
MRDETDRKRYLGHWHPTSGHFNGPRYWLGDISGRTRALDITTAEMWTIKGRRRARELFISATRWAEQNGAKVILLAAGTKRLFEGDELVDLKARFPKIIFTIGDNGTVLLLIRETLRALQEAGLKPCYSRIAVLGPYGFLGEIMTKTLKGLGYEIVGAGPNPGGLEYIAREYGITTCRTFSEVGKVDAVVACTHSPDVSLSAEGINSVRRSDKKLLVIDVAEPSNLRYEEYLKCKEFVVRQDAGNAYSSRLEYVLGAISYRMFRLTRGVTFGCFAEALSLASALRKGDYVSKRDWMIVNDKNMELVTRMFERESFAIPSARCFGRPVKSFNLVPGEPKSQTRRASAWKLAMQRLHII